MRRLIVHRERALACFAMKYHCIVGRDREAFLNGLKGQDQPVHLWNGTEPTLRNGETISVDIEEGPATFFVVACLDGRDLATEEVTIEPGEGDVAYVVRTDYDGNRRLGIRVVPAESR